MFWTSPSRWSFLWTNITSLLHKEFSVLLGKTSPGGTIIFTCVFSLILYNNLIGLIPYVFTRTRHLAITLRLSLPLWLAFIFYGWFNHTTHILAHLVPSGTPGPLMPLIVLIETIRNIIRPGTLAVRLAANIIAGHLLLTLIRGAGPSLQKLLALILVLTQILLIILETAVAAIQSFVFAALRTLYASETK